MANGDGRNDTDIGNQILCFYLQNDGKQESEMITKVFPIILQQHWH